MSEPRYEAGVCLDCGVRVEIELTHTRFHAILNSHAAGLAVIGNSHISANVHNRWDVHDRLAERRNANNWSAEAFAEVVGAIEGENDVPRRERQEANDG